jgi:hypothetical protein
MREYDVATSMRRARTETRRHQTRALYTETKHTDAGDGISQPLDVAVKHWCRRTI